VDTGREDTALVGTVREDIVRADTGRDIALAAEGPQVQLAIEPERSIRLAAVEFGSSAPPGGIVIPNTGRVAGMIRSRSHEGVSQPGARALGLRLERRWAVVGARLEKAGKWAGGSEEL